VNQEALAQMKYMDPLPVTCGNCSAESKQRVADLYALRAVCPHCGGSLAGIGQRMRAVSDDLGSGVAVVELLMRIEEEVGMELEIPDTELEGVETLRALAHLVRWHLPPSPEADARSIALVFDAIRRPRQPQWAPPSEDALDLPILEALYPRRWEGGGKVFRPHHVTRKADGECIHHLYRRSIRSLCVSLGVKVAAVFALPGNG
jgi:hypothetical protein